MTTTKNNWRALCEELHLALERRAETPEEDRLLDRSAAALRAALAQPEPEVVEPSDVLDWIRGVEPWATWLAPGGSLESAHFEIARLVAEAVARFVRPAPAPAGEVAELVAWLRDHAYVLNPSAERKARHICDLLEQRQAAPVPVASDTRYEFSVYDKDYTEQAGGSAPTYAQALSEGQHYLAQYQQDGPHTLEVRRVEVLPPGAFPVPVPAPVPAGEVKHDPVIPSCYRGYQIEAYRDGFHAGHRFAHARAALAQPELEVAGLGTDSILALAAIIREVDGNHSLGAAALAEAILSHPGSHWGRPAPAPAGEVAELVAWLRGANWDSKRQTLATRAADLLEMCFSAKIAHDGSGNNE